MRPGVRKAVVPTLAVWLLCLPGFLLSQESRGANVVVTRKDGSPVAGELIAVKQNSLLILTPAGKDESVDVGEVSTVRIRGKSYAAAGALIGFVVGAVTGAVILNKIDDSPGGPTGKEYFGAGFRTGLVGVLPGLVIGAMCRSDKTIVLDGQTGIALEKELSGLRRKARIRNPQI